MKHFFGWFQLQHLLLSWTLTLWGKHIIIITISHYYYCLILNVDCKRSLPGYDVTLPASQYIRPGQNLKGYLGEGGDYLSYFKLLFTAHYLAGKWGGFSPRKISSGKFSVPPFYFQRTINQCKVPKWFRELHPAAFQWYLGSLLVPRTDTEGGRWRLKHAGQLHLSWILSGLGLLPLGSVGGRGAQFLPVETARKSGKQHRRLGLRSLAPPQLLWSLLFKNSTKPYQFS